MKVDVPGSPPVLVDIDPANFEIRTPDELKIMSAAMGRYGPSDEAAAAGAITVEICRHTDADPADVLTGVAESFGLAEVVT